MPPKPSIAPNEALFTHNGQLLGRGVFFPPQLVAPAEGKLFVIPPDAGLIKLIREYPDQSPPACCDLISNSMVFSLLLGWRKSGAESIISVKTVTGADWQQKLKLQPGFIEWLNVQDHPLFIVDNSGFILFSNSAASATFASLGKNSRELLFWSLLAQDEAIALQEIWSQPDREEVKSGYSRLLVLRDDQGLAHGALVCARRPDEEKAELVLAGQRLALEHAGEGLLLLDKFGFILYASPNSAELLGTGEGSLAGRRLLSLVKDARQNMLLGRMLGGERIAIPLIVEIKQGDETTVRVRLEVVELTSELKDRAALALRIKPAQELLRQEDREARLSLLDELLGFDSGPLLASFSTTDGTLLYISPNSVTWTGITPDQFQLNPRRFWSLFPSFLFTSTSEPSSTPNVSVYHTILEKADGTVIPVKLHTELHVMRHRRDVFVQILDSLALGEDYAGILKVLADLNDNPNLSDHIRLILGNVIKDTGSERVVVNIFDAITGNIISTVSEPDTIDEPYGESIPPDILPQAYETTWLAQRIMQQINDGTVVRRISIVNRNEDCGEMFLFASDAGKLEEVDLSPWLNLLGLAIVLWRMQNTLMQESELNWILGYGLENIVVQAIQKLARDLLDLTCAGENTIGKLNEITIGLEGTLTSIRELQLFATIDKIPPQSELVDLEQLLGEVGMEFTARLSQCGGLLTVERGLPQVIAPREYLRLVFSRLIEFAVSHHLSPQPLRLHISAFLLESATRVVFKINPSEITAEECQALFNPYFVPGNAQELNLGLALVKKLMETIGGNIIVLKDDTDSAIFSMFLPHRQR
jgi:PAS domain-containing protein